MTLALDSLLAKAGLRVDSTQFLSLVEDAARWLTPTELDPSAYLSATESRALTDVGLDISPARQDELDPRARAVAAKAVLREQALTVAEAAKRIDVDDSRIRHRIKAGRLIGWKELSSWRLPAWQFTDTGVLPGLDSVLAALPRIEPPPPLVLAAFMVTAQQDLPIDGKGAAPRDWLLAGGDPSRVATLVSMLGTSI
ncbi:MAG: DNA-binding protein [Sciscionella sp.]